MFGVSSEFPNICKYYKDILKGNGNFFPSKIDLKRTCRVILKLPGLLKPDFVSGRLPL